MQLDRRIHLCIALIVGVLVSKATQAETKKVAVKWQRDWVEAQAEAQRTGKPILIHFHASWCAPCRQLEREVLHSPKFLELLATRFVGVKVDIEAHPELPELYGVEALPADVYVAPDGKLIAKATGYDGAHQYFAQLEDFNAEWRDKERLYLARAGKTKRPVASPLTIEKERPAPLPPENPPTLKKADEEPVLETPPAIVDEPAQPRRIVGLNGFCPVTLHLTREWKRGERDLSLEHHDIIYRMADQSAYDQFRADPDRYAPRLLGCDPVMLWETDRAIPGSTKFGAYFDEHLYLFTNADNRLRFKQNPMRYVQSRHVLRVDEIELTTVR